MNITIRKAIAADIPLLKPLGIELQENERSVYPERAVATDIVDQYNDILLRDVKSGEWHVFVAEIDGKIVGYVSGTANDPEDDLENTTTGFYVGDLVVLGEYRSLGIGAKLMNAIIDYAKQSGFGSIELNVLAANERAQKFYKDQGFTDYEVVLRKRLV